MTCHDCKKTVKSAVRCLRNIDHKTDRVKFRDVCLSCYESIREKWRLKCQEQAKISNAD